MTTDNPYLLNEELAQVIAIAIKAEEMTGVKMPMKNNSPYRRAVEEARKAAKPSKK